MDSSKDGCLLELLGALASIGAWLLCLTTTFASSWLTLSTELLPTESYQLGLWETCVVQDLGVQDLLGLPPDIKLARILMCVAVAAGLLAALLAVPGLRLVTICDARLEDAEVKRVLRRVAAALGLATGVLTLLPVSHIAHLTVVRFFDQSVPALVPRWEFGNALFCGWAAGVMHLLAGVVLLASARRSPSQEEEREEDGLDHRRRRRGRQGDAGIPMAGMDRGGRRIRAEYV
ncbi:hypothetical protein CRUP_002233 [Coryphaenoides rupestris]|nr:hypothetical protein CRUP_002233 [Coryphaenoides rupestris]